MGFVNDLTGQRFGKLVVLERAGSSKQSKATWLCICDCGSETIVVGNNLQNQTRSCGCGQSTGTYSIRSMKPGGRRMGAEFRQCIGGE